MKLKFLYRAFVISVVAILTISCNDELDQIGFTIQPGKDRLTVGLDTLPLQAQTVQIDSIFSKTQYPVLGEYIDPIFGSIKSGYVGEFYFPEGASFHDDAIIDSVRVQLAYMTMMGDSLSPMGLSVYAVNKLLKGASPYSNFDPTDYVDMSAPLGEQIFSGKNSTFTTQQTSSGGSIKIYEINVKLPTTIGQEFLNEYKKPSHGKLTDPDSFREFFPGLYFTTTFGKSTIVNIEQTSLMVHYKYNDKKGSSTGQDTIRSTAMRLYITPEVTQITQIENKHPQLLEANSDYTYIKSPAGVMTQITFPFSELNEKLKNQALNLANLRVFAIPEEDESMSKLLPPNYLLLVNRDSMDVFFEERRVPDNVTSFLSGRFDASTYSYQFGNISTMVNYYNQKNDKKPFDLTYCLVPVDATFGTDSYGNSTNTPTSISHQMWPSGVKLDKREKNLKIDLIFSNF